MAGLLLDRSTSGQSEPDSNHQASVGACPRGARGSAAEDLHKTSICRAFLKDRCALGATCSFAHGQGELRSTSRLWKTSLCDFHAKGFCRHGMHCRHAHGVEELRGLPKGRGIAKDASQSRTAMPCSTMVLSLANAVAPACATAKASTIRLADAVVSKPANTTRLGSPLRVDVGSLAPESLVHHSGAAVAASRRAHPFGLCNNEAPGQIPAMPAPKLASSASHFGVSSSQVSELLRTISAQSIGQEDVDRPMLLKCMRFAPKSTGTTCQAAVAAGMSATRGKMIRAVV